MKIGVADYGMNVWHGGLYDIEGRLESLRGIGYDGIERLEATGASDAIGKAAVFRKLGMDFSTCRGPNVLNSIEWTAALGKRYVWFATGENQRSTDFAVFCRRASEFCRAASRYGLTAAIHNHMHQRVESQQELEDFLAAVPEAGIVFDTGHLSMAGGNPVEIVEKYHKKICVMHLKDVFLTGKVSDSGAKEYQFRALGDGNNGFDNAGVLEALLKVGWDGWIHIEQDNHQQEPLVELEKSIKFIRNVIS
ncbi:MAG: sugar phosphate isomerase/epimerase [Victivallales bacterium]|nr:sugar phosphate isomerase/epimerase [Victivallales bacterium]